MRNLLVSISLTGLFCMLAFNNGGEISFPRPAGWPQPEYNFDNNPLHSEKIELGRALFYDPILSRDSTISCASCHLQYTAFAHTDHDLSHGIEGRIATRNAATLVNLAWNKHFMWDGALHHLDMQSLAPISNNMEMDENLDHVVFKLKQSPRYRSLFSDAFSDTAITGAQVLRSLSQFMLTLVSANAKYDKVRNGKEKFTEQEERGYQLFQQHCNHCHTEPLFTNGQFESNGLSVDETLKDKGRMTITGKSEDSLRFKVPSLRNIEFSFPYMHDGRFKTLHQVLNHYTAQIQQTPTLHPTLQHGIPLSSNDKVDIIAFLLTLTDKDFLFDPRYSFPK
ncbi:MAG TPA: cytochrome c peroxidase [Flavipsychrobacter sp.]|nr:cytochrome c peroxidase [Flavipsychrobacter sp.]